MSVANTHRPALSRFFHPNRDRQNRDVIQLRVGDAGESGVNIELLFIFRLHDRNFNKRQLHNFKGMIWSISYALKHLKLK